MRIHVGPPQQPIQTILSRFPSKGLSKLYFISPIGFQTGFKLPTVSQDGLETRNKCLFVTACDAFQDQESRVPL
jgi:hypothetical protein